MLLKYRGSGGGDDDGGQKATEAPDTLASKQYLRIIDLISEGPVEGLVNNLQSIYVAETPIQNPDGSMNVDGFSVQGRNGTVDQTYVQGFEAAESEKAVGVKIKKDTPIVRSLEGTDLDAVRVSLGIPALQVIHQDTGSSEATHVEVGIDIQKDGGGFVPQILSKIKIGEGSTYFTQSNDYNVSMLHAGYKVGLSVYWQGTPSPDYQRVIFIVERSLKGQNNFEHVLSHVFEGSAKLTTVLMGSGPYQSGNSYYKPPEERFFFYTNTNWTLYDYRIAYVSTINTRTPRFELDKLEMWDNSLTDRIYGKCTSKYVREYVLSLSGPGQYEVRVRRITDDSTTSYLQNDVQWETFTEIIDQKLSYPYSAYIAMTVDSSQYDGIPARAYDVKGRIVKVPVNYDAVSRIYSGTWDFDTFKTSYTDNPVWCLLDLITNTRYGLGKYVPLEQVDLVSFYRIAQYCDEPVPNGYGGFEPRYTCSLYMQGNEDAYKVLSDMASIFNGMIYWVNGTLAISADMPDEPAWIFTNANVVDGEFVYQGSSKNTRYTTALVTYVDAEDRFAEKTEYVTLPQYVAKYGVRQTSAVAVGCSSRGQAVRFARNVLLSSCALTELVSFTTGIEGAGSGIVPGSVIKVHDANRVGKRWGGRILSATTSSITIDSAVDIAIGDTYTLSVLLPNGTMETREVIFTSTPYLVAMGDGEKDVNLQYLAIIDSSGEAIGSYIVDNTFTVITLVTPFSQAPARMAMWMLESNTVQAQLFRVVSITEKDVNHYEITGLEYNESKYAAVDEDAAFIERPISTPYRWYTPSPARLSVVDASYLDELGNIRYNALVSFTRPVFSSFSHSVLWWRYVGEQWQDGGTFTEAYTDIPLTKVGDIEVSVQHVSQYGIYSNKSYARATITGNPGIPPDVTNFLISIQGASAYFSWEVPNVTSSKNISHYIIKHSTTESSSVDWGSAVIVADKIAYPTNHINLTCRRGTYLIKAVSKSGLESANATSIINSLDGSDDYTLIRSVPEHPYYSGVKDHTSVGGGKLFISGSVMKDWTPLNIAKPLNYGIGAFAEGTYYLTPLSLAEVNTVRLTANIVAEGSNFLNYIGSWSSLAGVANIGGAVASDWSVVVYYRWRNKPEDAWSEWIPLSSTEVTLQYAEFKAVLKSLKYGVSPVVSELSITVDGRNRVEGAEDITTDNLTGKAVIDYKRGFYRQPAVAIIAQNMATGDYYEVIDKDLNGFTIIFKNSSGTPVQRTFDWIAKGMGYSYGPGGVKYIPRIPAGGYE